MLINLLKKCGVEALTLADYDGFKTSNTSNYFDNLLTNITNSEQHEICNNAIVDFFRKIRKTMNITFITPTIYDRED